MTIFRQAANIPTVASSVANIGTFAIGVAGKLVLNGPIASGTTGQVSFINNGYASGLSFTSLGNISAASFTIVGTYNGTIVTEIIVGPNVNTVYTNNLFHSIISINISIPATAIFTIGSNYNVAVVLQDGNSRMGDSHSNYTYSVLLNSITAAAQWGAGSAIIYGVSNVAPALLQVSSLTYGTRGTNYFSLPVTGAALAAITQIQLNNGIITQTTYPYSAVMVCLLGGINTTPAFIEISQS